MTTRRAMDRLSSGSYPVPCGLTRSSVPALLALQLLVASLQCHAIPVCLATDHAGTALQYRCSSGGSQPVHVSTSLEPAAARCSDLAAAPFQRRQTVDAPFRLNTQAVPLPRDVAEIRRRFDRYGNEGIHSMSLRSTLLNLPSVCKTGRRHPRTAPMGAGLSAASAS